jgi:ABC-type sugar transport system substrate-binding protein
MSSSHRSLQPRLVSLFLLLLLPLFLPLALSGCDASRPAASSSGAPAGSPLPTPAKAILLILPSNAIEIDVWSQAARFEAALQKVVVEVETPPAGSQPQALLAALERDLSAIVIVPEDPQALAPALKQAQQAALPVVQLLRAIEPPSEHTPLVQYPDGLDAAAKLVQAAKEDALGAGFPPNAAVAILHHDQLDLVGLPLLDHLKAALEKAGIPLTTVKNFSGYQQAAADATRELLKSHPDLAILLADDEQGLKGAVSVRAEIERTQRRFVIAGFSADRDSALVAERGSAAGVVNLNIQQPIQLAIRMAVILADGGKVQPVSTVEFPFTRSSGVEEAYGAGPQMRPSSGGAGAPKGQNEPQD